MGSNTGDQTQILISLYREISICVWLCVLDLIPWDEAKYVFVSVNTVKSVFTFGYIFDTIHTHHQVVVIQPNN